MRKIDLEYRFERTMNLVRLNVQSELTRFFEEDLRITSLFLEAAGIRFNETGITDYDRGFWSPYHSDLYFLASSKGGAAIDGIFESPIGAASRGNATGPRISLSRDKRADWYGHLAAAAASLFGTWVFFYDRARGSYYFPFPGANYQFASVDAAGRPSAAMPSTAYRRAVTPLLRGFSLEIGQGSLGLARRLDRNVIVEDTLSDPRGSVALEDLLLRNFCFWGVGVSSTARTNAGRGDVLDAELGSIVDRGRFVDRPYALLGLVFPAPLRGLDGSEACMKLYEKLTLSNVSDLLEPLACHVDDTVLRMALGKVADQMAGREQHDGAMTSGSAEDRLRDGFASAVAGRGDPFDDGEANMDANTTVSNLRDPFGIRSIHIIEATEHTDKFRVRRYWHGESSFARELRQHIEATTPLLNEADDGDFFKQSILANLKESLNNAFGDDTAADIDGIWRSAPIQSGSGRTANESASLHEASASVDTFQAIFGVAWRPDAGPEVSSNTKFSYAQRLEYVTSDARNKGVDELFQAISRWNIRRFAHDPNNPALPLTVDEVERAGVTDFDSAVQKHKTVEARLSLLGSVLAAPLGAAAELDPRIQALEGLLGRMRRNDGDQQAARQWSLTPSSTVADSAVALSATQRARKPLLSFSALKAPLGLHPQITVVINGQLEAPNPALLKEIYSSSTYRTLLLGALYGHMLAKAPGVSDWTAIRVSSAERDKESPLRSGNVGSVASQEIYGMATTLADDMFWERTIGRQLHSPLSWLLWRQGTGSRSGTIELALASDAAKEGLLASPMSVLSGSLLLMNWSKTHRRWSFCSWLVDTDELKLHGRPTSARATLRDVSGIEPLLKFVGHCDDETNDQRRLRPNTPIACYPQISSVNREDAEQPDFMPSAPRAGLPLCPCPAVARELAHGSAPAQIPPEVGRAYFELRKDALFEKDALTAIPVIWPLVYGNKSSVRGAAILFFSKSLGAEQTSRNALMHTGQAAIPGLTSALVNQAVDYLEFALHEKEAKERLGRQLGRFAHSLSDKISPAMSLLGLGRVVGDLLPRFHGTAPSPVSAELLQELIPLSRHATAQQRDSFLRAIPLLRKPPAPSRPELTTTVEEVLGAIYFSALRNPVLVYELLALFGALKKTLTEQPELPSGGGLGIENPFENARGWVEHVLTRTHDVMMRKSADSPVLPSLMRALADLDCRLEALRVYPAGSIALIIEELATNIHRYARSRPLPVIAIEYDDRSDAHLGHLTIRSWNKRRTLSESDRRTSGSSGLGGGILTQIVRANGSMHDVRPIFDGDTCEWRVTLDLALYAAAVSDWNRRTSAR